MSQSAPTVPARHLRRRRGARLVALATAAALLSACNGTWGIRSSFRTYVASSTGGQITTAEGATWVDAAGAGKGPFQWPIEWSTFDDATETGVVQFKGGATLQAHGSGSGYVLDVSVWNPRLEISGTTGTLIADLNYRPYQGTSPSPLPTLEAKLDVPFATVDLSGATLDPDAEGWYNVTDAPTTGITAAMTLIGFDQFYPGGPVELDPISVKFNPAFQTKTLESTPRVVVSRAAGLKAGDQITVWGYGFDPDAHTGTRPPLSGQKSGVYAIFGRFAPVWQPSTGAAGGTRTVIDQKWALPAASRAVLDPSGTGASYVTIDATGRFEAVVTVGLGTGSNPNYGVYTYPGSGATNATQETYTPVTLAP